MEIDFSVYNLVLEASLVVQIVVILLAFASIVSWAIILNKSKYLKQTLIASSKFEEKFWSGVDLPNLYDQARRRKSDEIMEKIFVAGFKEYVHLHRQNTLDADSVAHTAERQMRVVLSREIENLEANLPFLATVGSTSPYIGLFGTVWGIMNSFQALGNTQQAALSLVAPGISEALIATAMGLFAAIPAVIAYNRFTSHSDKLINRCNNFMEEFTALLQRQAMSENNNESE